MQAQRLPHGKLHQHPCRPGPGLVPFAAASGPSGGFSPERQCRRFLSAGIDHHVSTFLHPFAPPALPGFIATMSALTPARWRDFEARSAPRRRAVPRGPFSTCAAQVSSLHASHPFRSLPSPTTSLPPMTALTPNPSASWASRLRGPGLHLSIAGSPVSTAESSSLALRTAPSPPVAPHLTSRQRSYGRLQAGVGLPEEDSHLPGWNALASARSPGQAGR